MIACMMDDLQQSLRQVQNVLTAPVFQPVCHNHEVRVYIPA